MKQIFCQIKKCLACRSCELACALAHSQSKNLAGAVREKTLPKHRIRVELIDEKGIFNRSRTIAIQCRHCDDPPCLRACITGGIYQDEKTTKILINPGKCVACWSCIMVCPFGVISRDEGLRQAVKCDNCPDLKIPACVEACPTGALVYCEQGEREKEYLENQGL